MKPSQWPEAEAEARSAPRKRADDDQADRVAAFVDRLRRSGVKSYKGPVPGTGETLEITFERDENLDRSGQRRRGNAGFGADDED